MSSDRPFWFANENLLLDLLRVEIRSISELFASHPDLREFFDAPEATPQQRASCFAVLAHRKLMDAIYETFAGRHEQSPSLGDDEKHALELARNLVAPDAPAWVLETNEVVEMLPYRINAVLPEPLREGRFEENNSAQVESVKSLSNVEQIRALTEGVLDQQLRRLEQRWSVVGPAANPSRAVVVQGRESKKRKRNRTRDKQRMLRDKEISGIDDVTQDIYEFLKIMDERKVKPQPTWSAWPGSWREAYKNPHLRELIHKDKSRALARVKRGRQK